MLAGARKTFREHTGLDDEDRECDPTAGAYQARKEQPCGRPLPVGKRAQA
jgi:hypothetical protein